MSSGVNGASRALRCHDYRIKVLVLVEAISINGVAKTVLNLCDSMAELAPLSGYDAFEITVALFQRRNATSPKALIEALRTRRIGVRLISERYRFDHRVFAELRRIANEIEPDIIQTNSIKSHFLVKAAGLHRQFHWIALHHGYTAQDLKMRVYNQLDYWSLRSAECVVVPCSAFQNHVLERGVESSRVRVIPNAMCEMPASTARDLALLRQRLRCNEHTKVILSVGRLSREKGYMDLVRAMRALIDADRQLSCKLIIVGQGPEEDALRAAIRDLQLDHAVRLLCSEGDVVPFYRLADVFVLPSLTEGMPNVVFEAIAAEVPIVATAVGGIPEMLRDVQTAVLVQPGRPDALRSAILDLLNSSTERRRMAGNARALARHRFSIENYGRTICKMYFEVLRESEWLNLPLS
ncbi:MAG TPA: glycosyltransferase family 4 protein [Bryobacteraceae bacterium]|jgi:glycosyltransferase involved in cell wall biosynthesis